MASGLGAAVGRESAGAQPKPGTACLAMGTYGMPSVPLETAIQRIAETGFDGLEITVFPGSSGDPQGLDPAARRRLRAVIEGGCLRLVALMAHLAPSPDPAAHAARTEELKRLAGLARDLVPDRPPLIQTVLGGKEWEKEKGLFRDRLADWVEVCASHRLPLAIKPHREQAMSRPSEAIWLIEQLGRPAGLRLVYDPSHFVFRDPELTLQATLEEAAPWTAYVALKDAVKEGAKVRFDLPGATGTPDHAAVIRSLHALGYRGTYCAEISSQVSKGPGYQAETAIRLCHRHLAEAFERAGVAREGS